MRKKRVLQKWVGYVDKIYPNYFKAKLYDMTVDDNIDYAEIPVKMVRRSQIHTLHVGAKFIWTIYSRNTGGTTSDITFVKEYELTEQDKAGIVQFAKEISEYFSTMTEELSNYFSNNKKNPT